MQIVPSKRRWLASVAGALALSGALLTNIAAAQTPSPQPPRSAAADCPPPPTTAQIAEIQARFTADLATALGKAPADVQRALQEVERQFPAPSVPAVEPGQFLAIYDDVAALAPVAAQLGVTAQELAGALKAAMPAQVCVQFAVAGPGATTAIQHTSVEIDMAPLFANVAQQLGRGITATQVEAALKLVHPIAEHPPVQAPASIDEHVQALARALGVSVDELKAALQSLGQGGIVVIRGPRTP